MDSNELSVAIIVAIGVVYVAKIYFENIRAEEREKAELEYNKAEEERKNLEHTKTVAVVCVLFVTITVGVAYVAKLYLTQLESEKKAELEHKKAEIESEENVELKRIESASEGRKAELEHKKLEEERKTNIKLREIETEEERKKEVELRKIELEMKKVQQTVIMKQIETSKALKTDLLQRLADRRTSRKKLYDQVYKDAFEASSGVFSSGDVDKATKAAEKAVKDLDDDIAKDSNLLTPEKIAAIEYK